jgi:hypothetical protein
MLLLVEYILHVEFSKADGLLDSFFKPALLHSKTSTTSESSIDK